MKYITTNLIGITYAANSITAISFMDTIEGGSAVN